MKLAILMLLLVAFVSPLQAQNSQGQNPNAQSGKGAKSVGKPASSNFVIPLPSSRWLSPAQLAGKKMFLQRCSACHLPGTPIGEPYGPFLDGKLVASRGEAAVRELIMQGSVRMPGFQYTLKLADIDNIIAYVKTLVYDPVAKKYSYSSTKK
jgi:cbb3-type cytochrome c oxidase subunit III